MTPLPGPRPEHRSVDRHIGERIRERRAEMGLTQEELGAALSISYQQVQKYETGANRVSAGRLFDIAATLGVDIAYFFASYRGNVRGEPLPHGGHNRSAIELVRNFLDQGRGGARSRPVTAARARTERGDANGRLSSRAIPARRNSSRRRKARATAGC